MTTRFLIQAATVVQEIDWRTVAEVLFTALMGALAWFGKRVVNTVDRLDGKFDGALERFSQHNDRMTATMSTFDTRLEDVEHTIERRRKPRER